MEYMIIKKDTAADLEKRVAFDMADGWVPRGGVAIAFAGMSIFFFQAMTRNEPKG